MRRGIVLLMISAGGVLAIAGCAGGEGSSSTRRAPMSSAQIQVLAEEERDKGHAEQAAALKDGVVTFEEYDASYTTYAECLAGKGFAVTGPVISPVDGVTYESSTDIGTHERTAALAGIDECEATFRKSVSQAYELSQPQTMDPPLAAATASCLRGKGLEPTGEEATVVDFVDTVGVAEDEEVLACVTGEAARLYPELPSISAGY